MIIFYLPDLGEGLPDAEICEWFVSEGDHVTLDTPLVSMETAKAVVDVPAPQTGIIAKLFGQPGDTIKTGTPLMAFESPILPQINITDNNTVVGKLSQSLDNNKQDDFIIGSPTIAANLTRVKASPAVRLLAKQYALDINVIKGTGDMGIITKADIDHARYQQTTVPEAFTRLSANRRAMFNTMTRAQQTVVAATIVDEAMINHWQPKDDITVRLIQAIVDACAYEPALNAWFDSTHLARQCFKQVNLGLAMDTGDDLFVPVIRDAARFDGDELRVIINNLKQAAQKHTLDTQTLTGASIVLSNFGKFAGRFATPIVTPPCVAILAAGRIYHSACIENDIVYKSHLLPLSLSFDHRVVTGGEASRFLSAVITALHR